LATDTLTNTHLAHSVEGLAIKSTAAPASTLSIKWRVPPIPCHEPEDRIYYAQLGPSGGENGYSTITGKVRHFSSSHYHTFRAPLKVAHEFLQPE